MYSKEALHEEAIREIAARSASETAQNLKRRFLEHGNYATYFALTSIGDRTLTLKVVYVDRRGKVKAEEKLIYKECREALVKPRRFDAKAKELGAEFVVASLSAPDGFSAREAFAAAEKLYGAMRSAELFDFVFIDRGKLYSVIRSIK